MTKRKLWAMTAGLCVSILFSSLALFSACKEPEMPVNSAGQTEAKRLPTDGSKPTDHSGLDNLAYLNYQLSQTKAYSVDSYGTVMAKVGISYQQEVWTYKDYKDGVMVVEDVSTSAFVNTASQSCFVGDTVLIRDPQSKKAKDWDGRNTAWKSDQPTAYSKEGYLKNYGLFCTDFSVYVLNENTVSEATVADNGDGTYSLRLTVDGNEGGKYYVRRMKTMGGLSDYPTFHSVDITYIFNENWQVLSSHTEENYAFQLAVLSSDNTKAITDQTYFYDESRVDISDYTQFFSRYASVKPQTDDETEEREAGVSDYLVGAFAPVLTESVCFNARIGYGVDEWCGTLYLDASQMPSIEARLAFGDLRLWLEGNTAYLQIGKTLASLPLSDITDLVALLTPDRQESAPSETESAQVDGEKSAGLSLNTDDLLASLMEGELTSEEKGATLRCRLTLGEVVLPITFAFTKEGKTVGLDYVSLDGLQLGENMLTVRLEYGDKANALPELTAAQKEKAVSFSPVAKAVPSLLSMQTLSAEISMTVGNDDEKYASCDFVKYDVQGSLALALAQNVQAEGEAERTALCANLQLSVVAREQTDDSFYFDVSIYDGVFYLTVSYFTPDNEKYAPLRLKGVLENVKGIVDTVKTYVGYDLSFLFELFGFTDTSASADDLLQTAFALLAPLEWNVATDENGALKFGVSHIVYQQEPFGELSVQLGITPDAVLSVSRPSGEFIDFSSVDEAIQSVLASFTKVEDNALQLLDGYYFAGKITGKIGSYTLEFDVAINLRIVNGSFFLNATIGAGSKFAVNSGRYLSYLTLDLANGIVCMQRYQYEYYSIICIKTYSSPVITYRSMTLQEFGDDYWNQIKYLTNMGDVVAGLIGNMLPNGGEGSPAESAGLDIGSYLKKYEYSCDAEGIKTYKITLNGENFSSSLGDMALTITCDRDGRVKNITGDVNVVILLSLDIDYENTTKPNGDYSLQIESLQREWGRDGYEAIVRTGVLKESKNLADVVQGYASTLTLVNGDECTQIKVVLGEEIILPVLPDSATHVFGGWYTQPNGQGERVESGTKDGGLGGRSLYAYYVPVAEEEAQS